MTPVISLIGICLGLVLLIFLAYKGHSIIWVAPVCAALVAILGGLNVLQTYLEEYIGGAAAYIASWFPAFFLGAVYGKIMDLTGSARSLANKLVSNCKHKESYMDVCVTSCIIPVVVSLALSFIWGLFI